MKSYRIFCHALCVWLSLLTGFGSAFAHTNDTPYGRAQVTWPDLGHEGGTTLQTKITDGIAKISNNLVGRWTPLTVANLGSTNIIHNFGLAIAKLKILVFESGSQLTAAQLAANYTFAQVDTNTVSVTNVSGSSKTFQVIILSMRGGIEAADFDAAVNLDTSGTVRASELRTSANGDIVVNHSAAQSGADWKAQLHRPTSGMSANAVYTLPLSTATFATTSLSESFTNKNLKSSTNLLTGAKADSLLTETGSNTVTLPPAGGTLSTLAGSETLTNKNLANSNNTLSGATSTSFTNSGTITLPSGTTTLVGRDTTDNLTNKSISTSSFNGGTASSTQFITLPSASLATLQALARTAGKIYYATDTTLVYYDNGSVLSPVGSGSGSGLKNYISNDGVETDTTGYATYADAAGTTPVDGTAGSATALTLSRTTTAGELLDGTATLKLAKSAANGQGQGFSYDFVMDNGYTASPQQIYALVNTSAANYVAGDIVACVYDKDTTQLVVLSGATVGSCVAIPKADKQQFKITFNPLSNTSVNYRLIFHVSTTNATAYNVFFDKITVTPLLFTNGPIVSASDSCTANTQGFGTIGGLLMYCTRIADRIYVQGRLTTGTPTGVEARISLPTGLSVGVLGNSIMVGQWWVNDATGVTVKRGDLVSDNSISHVTFGFDDYTTANSPFLAKNGNAIVNPGTVLSFMFNVPVTQWSYSGNIVNGPNIECATNTSSATAADDLTSFSNDCNGSPIQNITAALKRRVRWLSAMQPSDVYLPQVSANRLRWVTITGGRNLPGNTQNIAGYMDQAGATYGIGRLGDVNTTDMDLYFGTYAVDAGGAYGAAGSSWTAQGGSTTYYRVLKLSGTAATAYAEAVPGVSAGFVSQNGVKGFTDGSTASLGYVGQVIRSGTISNTTPTTSDSDVTGASITLTPGAWQIFYSIEGEADTGTTSGDRTLVQAGVYTSANVQLAETLSRVGINTRTTASMISNGKLQGSTTVDISASTTYKLRCIRIDVAGTGTSTIIATPSNAFYAVRIR